MSFRLTWEIEQRIILCKYYGDLTLEVVNGAAKEVAALIEGAEQSIHLVLDMQETTAIRYTVQESAARQLPFDVNALGWVVYVGSKENAFFRFMASALAQYRGLRVRWFESKTEALRFLKDVDSTLPDLDEAPLSHFDSL
ncbi:MAG: hypothetical protein K8I82_02870 [Anaerolineae bacterium]|nr:hypothetical protein [Anaerolineae bacterium]